MSEPKLDLSAIERELAELGEDGPSAEELALLEGGAVEHSGPVASVVLLSELSQPHAFDDLSELETHRGWRKVEARLGDEAAKRAGGPGSTEPASKPGGAGSGSPRRWLYAAFGVAAAAALTLIVVDPNGNEGNQGSEASASVDAEELAAMGKEARGLLDAIDDGKTDTERAQAMLADYEARLSPSDAGDDNRGGG
ncbi:hypothetical protein PPSIR1_39275 [Plesiocystis pacifica SIR-1]|uniref:Uncharacterized protein n=1 Tax=Plesiocystis pacifica SIR-1 TaxID=391625 RepID=A6FXY5_9BACT|nr:hypothetical protein [Plesiocystis pacifica]EDM81364.1 hypothetical protein PPSIR1_39275 [Plesiocystis pacifica SIR-1]